MVHKKELANIRVESASEKDIPAIIAVEEKTWISSYPNKEVEISKEDVKARFNPLFKAEGQGKLKAKWQAEFTATE